MFSRAVTFSLLLVSQASVARAGDAPRSENHADGEPLATLSCEIEALDETEMRVRYRFVNSSGVAVRVFERPLTRRSRLEFAPDAYVLAPAPGRVLLTRQLIPVPEGVRLEAPPVTAVTRRVEPGKSITGTFAVPLPLAESHPYVFEPRTFALSEVDLSCGIGYVPVKAVRRFAKGRTWKGEVRWPRYDLGLVAAHRVATASLSLPGRVR